MPATNVLPQVADVPIEYYGSLDPDKFISLVDYSDNDYNPCSEPTVAGHVRDTSHSGPLNTFTGRATLLHYPSLEPALSDQYTYALCYTEGNGGISDPSWRDSYIRLKISLVETIVSHSVTHQTEGGIANIAELPMEFTGPFGGGYWVSFVAHFLNSNFPCAPGQNEPVEGPDALHSGPVSTTTSKSFTLNTFCKLCWRNELS
jgi:hypothetical protein